MIPTQGSTSVHMAGMARESMNYLSVVFLFRNRSVPPTGDVTILNISEGHDPHDTGNADTIRSSMVLAECGKLLKDAGGSRTMNLGEKCPSLQLSSHSTYSSPKSSEVGDRE